MHTLHCPLALAMNTHSTVLLSPVRQAPIVRRADFSNPLWLQETTASEHRKHVPLQQEIASIHPISIRERDRARSWNKFVWREVSRTPGRGAPRIVDVMLRFLCSCQCPVSCLVFLTTTTRCVVRWWHSGFRYRRIARMALNSSPSWSCRPAVGLQAELGAGCRANVR
jgi:hypothetical protein